MNSTAAVLFALVAIVTALGFWAARWGRSNLSAFDEWALGGRRFGTLVTWFLIGGDTYTAYTFIAVPALAYGAGAIAFFAVPYATVVYPFIFIVMARFWTVAKKHGYVTTADFVHDRFGSRTLEIAVALTGVLATMPYIALQLLGVQAVLLRSGIAVTTASADGMLVISFALLAAYTFTSGLRAPAAIAFVKDALIYVTIVAALIVIPAKLGGWAHIFSAAQTALAAKPKPGSILLPGSLDFGYASLALGSALALFIYPHAITSVLSAKSAAVVRRNCAFLPLYTLLLGFLALLGYCALAAGIHVKNPSEAIPALFMQFFPGWFAGVAFAAIVIGALVPAAIMAIGAANLFASNLLQSFRSRGPGADPKTRVARYLSLVVLGGALAIALTVQPAFAIDYQLLGGAWILQIFPAVIIGLYVRLHPRALLAGWAAGMAAATWMAVSTNFSSLYALHVGNAHIIGAIVFYSLVVNLAVTLAGTALLGARAGRSGDLTGAGEYA